MPVQLKESVEQEQPFVTKPKCQNRNLHHLGGQSIDSAVPPAHMGWWDHCVVTPHHVHQVP